MIVVIDYGRGNLFSLGAALDRIGRPYRVSDNPNDVRAARQLILPGVGAFGDATTALEQRGLKQAILAAVDGGASLLGICVGCQLLMTSGTEFGMFPGLGIIPGTVERLPEGNGSADEICVPNVGWREFSMVRSGSAIATATHTGMVYFVHSYAPVATNTDHVLATITVNGCEIQVAVSQGNVTGLQFHPERSGLVGLSILERVLQ